MSVPEHRESLLDPRRNIMNKKLKIIVAALAVLIVLTGAAIPILASVQEEAPMPAAVQEEIPEGELQDGAVITSQADAQTKTSKALAAAIVVGIAAAAGAVAMALAISKSVESTARQPEAGGKIQTMMMLGLVFIETAIIYALIVAILIVFVL